MTNEQNSKMVLIADDDPTSLLMLEALAVAFKLETVTATSVAGAKRLLKQVTPDIAILDVLFPDGDGIDILLEIRGAGMPTAVALISATLEEFPFHKCEENQPDVIFKKPIDCQAVSSWIERHIASLSKGPIPAETSHQAQE